MQPILETERLRLRAYTLADAADVQRLAGDPRIADTTANIPHPYPDGAAEHWIAGLADAFAEGRRIAYAATLRDSGELLGTISLHDIAMAHARAELGYWIAAAHWGRGYCTEAVRRLMQYGCDERGLTRITAVCLARNPASARVMEKAGLRREGRLVAHELKNGVYEDLLVYGWSSPQRIRHG